MPRPNLEEIEKQEAKKHALKAKRKKVKMKVSGAGVKKLQEIVSTNYK